MCAAPALLASSGQPHVCAGLASCDDRADEDRAAQHEAVLLRKGWAVGLELVPERPHNGRAVGRRLCRERVDVGQQPVALAHGLAHGGEVRLAVQPRLAPLGLDVRVRAEEGLVGGRLVPAHQQLHIRVVEEACRGRGGAHAARRGALRMGEARAVRARAPRRVIRRAPPTSAPQKAMPAIERLRSMGTLACRCSHLAMLSPVQTAAKRWLPAKKERVRMKPRPRCEPSGPEASRESRPSCVAIACRWPYLRRAGGRRGGARA